MSIENQIEPYQRIDDMNRQRSLHGELDDASALIERGIIERVLEREGSLLGRMALLQTPLSGVDVNPDLTIFLDGTDGMGGYADSYAEREWEEPGTRLEMLEEKRIMREHMLQVLSPEYIAELKEQGKPLVIIEGGAGPDLRTIGTVADVLEARVTDLQGIPIKLIHVDISERMAAITAAKARTSGVPEKLTDLGLEIETAICHADVFDVLEKIPDDSLSYALLPFGVLSFGLDGKDPSQILENVRSKLRRGGGTLATVYNSEWRDYTDVLESAINCANENINGAKPIEVGDLNPFVIQILDGKLQVGGGLAFNCTTFTADELTGLVSAAGLTVDSRHITPPGWAYWPEHLLQQEAAHGNPPSSPPEALMDMAKRTVLDILEGAVKNRRAEPIQKLRDAIPDGNKVAGSPAPYITMTARK